MAQTQNSPATGSPQAKPGETTPATQQDSDGPKQAPAATRPADQTTKKTAPPHAKSKSRKHKAHATKKKPSSAAASKSPHKAKPVTEGRAPDTVVVPNGGTGDPKVQLSPEVPRQQAKSQRKNVDQLLASTDANLKALSTRRLNSDQQDMVRQIRVYMEQAKEAAAASDLQRAHNLALKASLLADEMAKQ